METLPKWVLAASAAPVLLLGSAAVAAAPAYTVTDLGVTQGRVLTAAPGPDGINQRGDVVGMAGGHAVLYSRGRTYDLGTLGGATSVAAGINNRDEVVGSSEITGGPPGRTHAFLYRRGRMQDLGTLAQGYSAANGINNQGEVVGSSAAGDGFSHAFLYSRGQMQDLGTLGENFPTSFATAINNRGVVVGAAREVGGLELSHAFLYSQGRMQDLGTRTSDGTGWSASAAAGINDRGEVVGTVLERAPFALRHAFIYRDGSMDDLGTLGGNVSEGNGINNRGEVVGSSDIGGGIIHAFLYNDGRMTDLNDLIPADSGWTLTNAAAINDAGEIAAGGIDGNNAYHALLLSPVCGVHGPARRQECATADGE